MAHIEKRKKCSASIPTNKVQSELAMTRLTNNRALFNTILVLAPGRIIFRAFIRSLLEASQGGCPVFGKLAALLGSCWPFIDILLKVVCTRRAKESNRQILKWPSFEKLIGFFDT
jgi:hypothetical protein